MELIDNNQRKIEYLRISVTDKCNLRCLYCMPGEGVCFKRHEDVLSYEEVLRLVHIMVPMGVKKVRITGGEPMVRKDLKDFIILLGLIDGIDEITMTTNGLLLEGRVKEFRDAGLTGINISLDSTMEDTYRQITGKDGAEAVLKVLDEALDAGLRVKINCVPVKGINDRETERITLLAKDRDIDVRFIELMPIGCGRAYQGIPSDELLAAFEEIYGRAQPVSPADNDAKGPAECFRFEGFKGRVGFISPLSHKFCDRCNRLRLTAEGYLKPCLFYEPTVSLRDMMRSGASDEELESTIKRLCLEKPEGHLFDKGDEGGKNKEKRRMNEIGG